MHKGFKLFESQPSCICVKISKYVGCWRRGKIEFWVSAYVSTFMSICVYDSLIFVHVYNLAGEA